MQQFVAVGVLQGSIRPFKTMKHIVATICCIKNFPLAMLREKSSLKFVPYNIKLKEHILTCKTCFDIELSKSDFYSACYFLQTVTSKK